LSVVVVPRSAVYGDKKKQRT